MKSNLAIRAISAFTVLFFTLGLFYFFRTTGLLFFGLFIIILGTYEYSNMFFKNEIQLKSLYLLVSIISLPLFYLYSVSPLVYISLFLLSLGAFVIKKNESDVNLLHKNISSLFLGYFYTVICPFFLFKILSIETNGLKLFFSVLLITFSCDVFAYVFGRALGKKLIFPLVSPKKTVAGSIGGLLAASASSYITLFYLFNLVNPIYSLIIGLSCGVAAQTGDFFASLLKRVAGVKDSGKIMPGHGGVLDRFDGLYFSGPVFFVIYHFLNS